MTCPACDGERRRLSVPDPVRDHVPDVGDAAVVCTTCLRSWPAADVADEPEGVPGDVSDALPGDETAGVALLLVPELLSSVARNEPTIAVLLDVVEDAGADPRLALERLAEDPSLEPAVDLLRRHGQFEGLR